MSQQRSKTDKENYIREQLLSIIRYAAKYDIDIETLIYEEIGKIREM